MTDPLPVQLGARKAISYQLSVTTTKQELLDFAKEVDDKFGHLFNPPIRLAPGANPVINPYD
jgi:hypothetical protein